MLPRHLLLSVGLLIVVPFSVDASLVTCSVQLVDGKVQKICRRLSCPVNCSNGVCHMQLQRCICNEGYEFNGESCVPVCEPVCGVSEQCTAPNVCVCEEGYALVDSKCEPYCKTPCQDTQYCAAPNNCACLAGYNNGTNNVCEPICAVCVEHAHCIGPNVCECDEGYSLQDDGKCAPICDAELCANADCVEPYKCNCHAGYALNFDTFKCEPIKEGEEEEEEDDDENTISPLIDIRSGI
uniref:von Willebrand factor D and EGF domain-containing protein n=1 Tax=Zeugodacus cucurbitae TaxID=28588 RepID=A0A0A1WVF4_ZEUCU